MKIGINIKLDVTKIDKARLHKGKKGIYLDVFGFVDLDEVDQYGNNGFFSQQVSKEEREQGVRGPILGNCRVISQFNDENKEPVNEATAETIEDDDIPF